MGFFNQFSTKATNIADYTWSELFPHTNAKSGVAVNVDTALRVTTVFACARVLAEGVAQLPINLFNVDPVTNAKSPVVGNPLTKILARRPNEWMTSFEMRETMMFHAILTGNAYAYVGWGGGKVQELIPLVPSRVTIQRMADYSLIYYVSGLDGSQTTIPQENILHIRGPSWNGYLGMDAVQLAREAIGLAITTEETHASLHANGAQPGGVLAVKGKLDKEARERLKNAWQAFQGGVANRFKTAVLDVDATWSPLAMTGVDSQHLETRRFQIEEVCRAMRVFPQLVMHTDKTSTFASADAFFLAHVTHSLMPWITRWEQTIERVLLDDEDNVVCRFNTAALLRGDDGARADFYMKALGGARGETAYMTRNEVRALEDLNPIDGGDKLLIPVPVPLPTDPTQGGGKAPVTKQDLHDFFLTHGIKYNPNHAGSGPGGGQFIGGGTGANDNHPLTQNGVHAGSTISAKAVKKTWIAQSPLKNVDVVLQGSSANKSIMDQNGARIAAATGTTYVPGSIKGADRINQKIDEGRLPAGVTDVVRSTFLVTSPKQADGVVAALGKTYPTTDEGFNTTVAGYLDRATNQRMPNGQIAETLIIPTPIYDAKKNGGHAMYKQQRALKAGDPQSALLLRQQQTLYAVARDKLGSEWNAILGKGGKSGN